MSQRVMHTYLALSNAMFFQSLIKLAFELANILLYLDNKTLIDSYYLASLFECDWAGRSAWNDRHVGIVEAAGSNPAPSTKPSFLKEG